MVCVFVYGVGVVCVNVYSFVCLCVGVCVCEYMLRSVCECVLGNVCWFLCLRVWWGGKVVYVSVSVGMDAFCGVYVGLCV